MDTGSIMDDAIPMHFELSFPDSDTFEDNSIQTTPVYDIKNTNSLIEAAINHVSPTCASSELINDYPTDTLAKTTERRIKFGNNKILTFNYNSRISQETRELNVSPIGKSSILKNRTNTKVVDDQDANNSPLLTIISRCFTLCNLKLNTIDKEDLATSLDRLSIGISAAFKTKELCYQYISQRKEDTYKQQIKILEKELSCNKKENEQLRAYNEELYDRLDIISKSSMNSNEIEEYTEKNKNRMKDLIQTKVQLEKARLDNESLHQKINFVTNENDTLRKHVYDNKITNEQLQKATNQLQAQLTSTELMLEQSTHAENSLRNNYQETSTTLQNKLKRKMVAYNKLKTENEGLAEKCKQLSAENCQILDDLDHFEKENEEVYQEFTKVHTLNVKLSLENESINKFNCSLKETQKNMNTIIKSFKDQQSLSEQEYTKLESKYNDIQKDKMLLEIQLQTLQTENTKLEQLSKANESRYFCAMEQYKSKERDFQKISEQLWELGSILRDNKRLKKDHNIRLQEACLKHTTSQTFPSSFDKANGILKPLNKNIIDYQ